MSAVCDMCCVLCDMCYVSELYLLYLCVVSGAPSKICQCEGRLVPEKGWVGQQLKRVPPRGYIPAWRVKSS